MKNAASFVKTQQSAGSVCEGLSFRPEDVIARYNSFHIQTSFQQIHLNNVAQM